MKPTKYQQALTKLHNLIESGEIIPDVENEHGIIAGHSKDGKISFNTENGWSKIKIERSYGGLEHNFQYPLERYQMTIKLAGEFQ
jgi:hypothetical protein